MKESKSFYILKNQGLKVFLAYKFKKIKYQVKRIQNHIYALDFNKSLPQNYKFVVFLTHLSGHAAFQTFFKLCGLNSICLINSNGKFLYSEVKKDFQKNASRDLKNNYCIIYNYGNKHFNIKYFSYVSKLINNTQLLILTRDPISRMKTAVNHGSLRLNQMGFKEGFLSSKEISLKDKPYEILDRICYAGGGIKPDISKENFKNVSFRYFTLLKPFLKPELNHKIVYIDMQELIPQKAFETMKNLAKELDFTPPKEEDKEKFSQIFWNKFQFLLPTILKITKNDFAVLKKDLRIKLCEKYFKDLDCVDLKEELIEKDTAFYEEIAILVNAEDLKIIKAHQEIQEKLKIYLKEFFKALEYWVNFKLQNQIKEEQILIYLKENKILRKKLKQILDEELAHIKIHRPDIVASWKYYNEFEKICEELDKIQ